MPFPEAGRALVRGIAEGDEEAAGLLQDSYRSALTSAARSSGLAPEDAQDAVQEALVAAIQQIRTHRYRGDAGIETWLQGILKHKVLDYWRGYFRRSTHSVPLETLETTTAISSSCLSAPGSAESLEAAIEVQDVLQGLPDDLRYILLLNETEGWTISEIAAMTKARPGTVGRKLAEAKDLFRRRILEPTIAARNHTGPIYEE